MQQDTFYYHLPPNYPQEVSSASPISHMNTAWTANPNLCALSSTPVSTALYGTTTTSSWAHTVPTFMPWVSKGKAVPTEQLMRFTAPFPPDPCTSQTATSWELLNNLGANKTNANLHLKRRSDSENFEIEPQKQFITEEKMTARMQELHISNQYSVPLENSQFGMYGNTPDKAQKVVRSIQDLEAMLADDSNRRNDSYKASLILAPEIKSLVEPEKIFANTFLNEIERPTMAVVLWQPPAGSVKDIMNSGSNSGRRSILNNSEDNATSSSASILEANNNSVPVTTIKNDPKHLIASLSSSLLSAPIPANSSASSQYDSDVIMDI